MEILKGGLQLDPLPELEPLDASAPHAPKRINNLTEKEKRQAVSNALRYFPSRLHQKLGKEFLDELEKYGHIYMYRFRPKGKMFARPISEYPAKLAEARAIMLMIQNNLDPRVAQFPHELVTYGGNGCVFSNWAQYWLVMKYLSELSEDQTLVLHSGHPVGFNRMFAMGVTQYGQMTAGSYAYIGPQGIVHGTTLTLLNSSRKYLGTGDMSGKVYVTSGLGGMSGAQPKAGDICGCITVVAEINPDALHKRHSQGWVKVVSEDLAECIRHVKEAREKKESVSIGYLGNVVDLWEALVEEEELIVDIGSDQTSLHNPYNGGYYPVGYSYEEANELMAKDNKAFVEAVHKSLVRQVVAINKLTEKGLKFYDYGNSFLFQASVAGADVLNEDGSFKYPSYVEDVMGDIFSLGFGPFRWVCTSGDHEDLKTTDRIAGDMISELEKDAPARSKQCYQDNLLWIRNAESHELVVGSEARILYSDAVGRVKIALAFNEAIRTGELKGPVVISRDHHDVSGTDSPFRETSNIKDGSQFCADMAVHNFVGDAMRGATWISLHNGGGVGWGRAINGGFGLVLLGNDDSANKASKMLFWDVNHGIARRAWCRNENAIASIQSAMRDNSDLDVLLPSLVSDGILNDIFIKYATCRMRNCVFISFSICAVLLLFIENNLLNTRIVSIPVQ